MRAIWKGALTFGLVNVPVKVYSATEDHDVPLHQVHNKDGGRIRYQRICEIDGEVVPFADIDKAYDDGERTVVLTKEDIDSLPAEKSREIDVVEYLVSAGKPTSWTKNLPQGTLNHFHVANHWGKAAGQSGTKLIDASAHGVNLRDGSFHTFGVAWQADRLIYYLDGRPVWETRNGVSTSDDHALMLSIEYDQGPGDAWGLDENILDHASKLPDTVLVDHVRVYARKP